MSRIEDWNEEDEKGMVLANAILEFANAEAERLGVEGAEMWAGVGYAHLCVVTAAMDSIAGDGKSVFAFDVLRGFTDALSSVVEMQRAREDEEPPTLD